MHSPTFVLGLCIRNCEYNVIMRAPCFRISSFYIIAIIFILLIFVDRMTISDFSYKIWTESGSKRYITRNVRNSDLEKSNNVYDIKVKSGAMRKEVKSELKYILQWTSPENVPFVYMGVGQQGFIDRRCPYTNCFVTSNRSYLGDYTKFDVIAFAGPELNRIRDYPQKRSPHQKYVFASIESSHYYPVCSRKFDGYFNWTWTYKLDSKVRWGYMVIRNENNTIVGPRKQMHWMKLEDMDPVSEEFKNQLSTKTKAAAVFVSNCLSLSEREVYVESLTAELVKYKLEIDVYGKCGILKCSRDNETKCENLIKDKYYFYLSFENSFSEDYVTEKLLHALQNNAIPIVYGGANYTRFMPDGIYLNARELSVSDLALKMNELIDDPDKYSEYFRWTKYYSYHRLYENVETDPYCLFCSTLNNKEMVKSTTIYKDFRKWWNTPEMC